MADILSLFPGSEKELCAYADWLSDLGQHIQFLVEDIGNYCSAMQGNATKWYDRMAPQVRGRASQVLAVFSRDVTTNCLSTDVLDRIGPPLEAMREACLAIVESSSEDSLGGAIDQFAAISTWYQRETKSLVKDIAIVIVLKSRAAKAAQTQQAGDDDGHVSKAELNAVAGKFVTFKTIQNKYSPKKVGTASHGKSLYLYSAVRELYLTHDATLAKILPPPYPEFRKAVQSGR